MHKFDVAIVGAGVVGLSLASLLAKADMQVIVFERGAIPEFDIQQPERRVSAITVASEQLFREIGVWQALAEQRVSTFKKMFVWEYDTNTHINFDCATLPNDHLGHIIENSLMQSVLYQHCKQQPQITIITECELQDAQVDAEHVTLTDSTAQTWSARLAVAADGGNSWLRQQMDFPTKERDYQHHALVTTVSTEHIHLYTAWQCFLPQGPLAFLPLRDLYHCSIVWSSTPEHIQTLMAYDDKTFVRALNDICGDYLGDVVFCQKRFSFPLCMRHAQSYVQRRIALVGDAAHSIHPLAGQGMNLGLLDAEALADVIIQTHQQRRDIGLLDYLKQYQRRRQQDNRTMLMAMDGFKWAFTNQSEAVQKVRRLGLKATDRLLPLKHLFMRRAMGMLEE